jgi:hypothetical protein
MRPLELLLISVLAGSALTAPTSARAGTGVPDFQQWSELDVVVPTGARTSVTAIGQLRVSESLPNPTYTASGVDFSYKDGRWGYTLGYRHQVTGHETDEPQVTQIARLTAAYTQPITHGALVLRFRVENTINASSNPWRIRLRPEYRWSIDHPRWVSYLYTNDEVFYRFQDDTWYRNRFEVGANLLFTQRSSARLYYRRQDDKFNNPGALNILGFDATIAFK